jgi:D-glycero-D-manno-heptose 1,7-bisphosphate phosphatase
MRPAIFIDRDGTINTYIPHLTKPESLSLITGSGEAIAKLNKAGFVVIVITNQSVISRGLLTEAGLQKIHKKLRNMLFMHKAVIDGIYFCPHHPDYGQHKICNCRKPSPGLIQQAIQDHGIDLKKSIVIGDNITDIKAGWAAGCSAALVLTGLGKQMLSKMNKNATNKLAYIGDNLLDVVNQILKKNVVD